MRRCLIALVVLPNSTAFPQPSVPEASFIDCPPENKTPTGNR